MVSCANNLKQLGLGLIQFHDNYKTFPSNGGWDGKQTMPAADGSTFTPETFDYTTNAAYKFGMGDPTMSPQDQTGNWAYCVLPYVDQVTMWQEPEWKVGIAVFVCPARRLYDAMPCVPEDDYGKYKTGGWPWARTDYGASTAISPQKWDLHAFANRPKCRTMAQFPDGLSNTILVGEKAYEVSVQKDNWYYDESLFVGGSKGTLRDGIGLQQDGPYINYKDNWGSAHFSGVQFLFADGTVHTLAFDVDPTIMEALMSPEGKEEVTFPWETRYSLSSR